MAETFTSDNTTDTEVLTTEEQDSLEVGEKLVSEQEGLLAGKYKNAEDLEQAYLSLQKKLGQEEETDYEESDEGYEEEEGTDEEVSEYAPAVSLINEASKEYYSNEGALSEETIEKFGSMSSQDLVNAYMEIQANNPQAAQQNIEMSDAQVNSVMNSAGGESNYNQIVEWAASNLNERQIDAFDSVVDSGNPAAIGIAFQGLQAQYNEANGYEGRMLTGKAASSQGQLYRSQAELVAAMGDPRYDTDPAYRQDVISKLEQSDLNF
nr:T7-like capsid assembly protein [uncultured Mediterranean phage uvMED]BAR27101.1 T7-like capsid assembly protein [uncultured Mediterranean phage uvMED]